jgi:hypothetical protein
VTDLEVVAAMACDHCALLCDDVVQTHPSFGAATRQFSSDQVAILACRDVCRLVASAVRAGGGFVPDICEWCAVVCTECASRERLNCDRWSELRAACNNAALRCLDVVRGEVGSAGMSSPQGDTDAAG